MIVPLALQAEIDQVNAAYHDMVRETADRAAKAVYSRLESEVYRWLAEGYSMDDLHRVCGEHSPFDDHICPVGMPVDPAWPVTMLTIDGRPCW